MVHILVVVSFDVCVRSLFFCCFTIGFVPPGCPRGSLGVLGGGLGGTQNRRGFLGGSREGPGGVLGLCWCSGVVLGSVLGCQNLDISLIIPMF